MRGDEGPLVAIVGVIRASSPSGFEREFDDWHDGLALGYPSRLYGLDYFFAAHVERDQTTFDN